MNITLSLSERLLLLSVLALLALSVCLPPLAQVDHYHEFADQRAWIGVPNAMDVLSNLPFAFWGLWGLLCVQANAALQGVHRRMAQLFFMGLITTAACSAWYHLAPTHESLAIDRYGMTVGFAGLMGLIVAGCVSSRAVWVSALASLVLGFYSTWVWLHSANLTPWAMYQFAAMAGILILLRIPPLPAALRISWLSLAALYALAKVFELTDHQLFEFTGWISGHTLKHVVASLVAWPVIQAVKRYP